MDVLMKGAQAGQSSKSKPTVEKPWVEKYRPKNTNEVAHQTEAVSVLKKCIEGNDMPHLLFYGPPGTGKTSTILAVARELFGPDLMKDRVLELNASDERGIEVVREKVKSFASLTVSSKVKGYPCPPYKIIVLDEADAMTDAAQSALRRTIENYSKVTRFCIICNYVSRIIDPLASRCAKFRFRALTEETMMERLQEIATAESVKCDPEVLSRIITLAEGDMRQAITFLQSLHRLKRGKGIRVTDVDDIAAVVPQSIIDDLFRTCRANSFEKLEEFVTDMMASGFPGAQILLQFHEKVIQEDSVDDTQKAKIMHCMAQMDKCLIDGADEHLQVMNMCAQTMSILSN